MKMPDRDRQAGRQDRQVDTHPASVRARSQKKKQMQNTFFIVHAHANVYSNEKLSDSSAIALANPRPYSSGVMRRASSAHLESNFSASYLACWL